MITTSEKPAHSPLGASSMYRWSKCPGSINFCKGLPDHTSSYAEEGTAAHEIAARWLKDRRPPLGLEEDLQEGLGVYIEAVMADVRAASTGGEEDLSKLLMIEHAFDLSVVIEGGFGTADAVVWNPGTRVLHVHDLKWGAGIPVEVKGNSQLKYYALGALTALGLPAREVEMVISQPRCPHRDGVVRRWRIPSHELIEFAADLREFAAATKSATAPLVAGDHCRFCKGAATCPAVHAKATALAKLEFAPSVSYEPVNLATALEWAHKMEAWAKNVREFAYGEAMHGRPPPAWKLVAKRATRKWLPDVTVDTLALATGKEPKEFLTEPSLVSPAQAEKKVPSKERDCFEPFYSKESSGLKLVPEYEPGEAVKLDPKSEFQKIS